MQVQDRGNFPSNRIDLHIGHDSPEHFGLQQRKVYRKIKKDLTIKELIENDVTNIIRLTKRDKSIRRRKSSR